MYIEIVIDKPLEKTFIYRVPVELEEFIQIGLRVLVPFGKGNRPNLAYIINTTQHKPNFKVKDIIKIIDDYPIFSDYEIKLAKWISKYYICTLGEALSTIVPKETQSKEIDFSKGVFKKELLSLNKEQLHTINEISKSIDEKFFHTYLLKGVTGSGKTEVYRHLAKKVIEKNKYALILVPEIALTPQNIIRFTEIFGKDVAVIHSKISPKEKIYNYLKILNNQVKIVLGARSAVFSPSKNLGIIIIDEEHETSYKSSDTPRYNAKQVAYKICRDRNIPLVMGTATPSIETYYNAKNGNISLLELKERHSKHYSQDIKVVDMKNEQGGRIFSQLLLDKINDRLIKNEQILIFLNRRGFSNYLLCLDCGEPEECPNCGIPYTYHKINNRLVCHYCGFQIPPPTKCAHCGSDKLKYFGFGTEQVENRLREIFANANIQRMDIDTTRRKNAYISMTEKMKNGDIDILVGTQMIAKGIHFPNITLVGVISADTALNIPDFRAAERSFSLLTQVSGRAGRGLKKGEVIIQTYNPDHYSIVNALKQDYEGFYNIEIGNRKEFGWVPFRRIIRLVMRSTNLDILSESINSLSRRLKKIMKKNSVLLGPAPCPIEKINRNYRYHIILISDKIINIIKVAYNAKKLSLKKKGIYLEIDVDPISMM